MVVLPLSALRRRGAPTHRDPLRRRLFVLQAGFFMCAGAIILRLFDLQVLRAEYFSSLAAKAQDRIAQLQPQRGSIYVRERGALFPVVTNRDYYLVAADVRQVADPAKVVDTLAAALELSADEWRPIAEKLARRADPYEPLRHKVTKAQSEKIAAAALPGLQLIPESFRYYPEPAFGGQLLGFLGFDHDRRLGRYGLEGYFERELAGNPGSLRTVADARGRRLSIGEREFEPPRDGENLVLTIDRTVQWTACDLLGKGIATYEAVGGTIVVLQPSTGAVLAMCSLPNFEPEHYEQVDDPSRYNNPAIFTPFEPGSVFKPITMAAAIDRGLITPRDTYEDTGEVKLVSGQRIRNADLQAHGVQTMVQVLEKSLNTGAVHVVSKLGKEQFRRYVQDFGFGQKTAITLDTEVAGDVSSLERRGEIFALTASFGQGITTTSLQLTLAFAALGNGGKLMRPYLVAVRISADGSVIATTQSQVVRQVVTPRTASTITGMLVQVVEGGWGNKAKVPGYYVAGKTGTAQIAEGGQYGSDVNHTFIGYLPSGNPKFVALVKLDRPTKVKHAADSTTVIFRQLAEFLVGYYQIPPER